MQSYSRSHVTNAALRQSILDRVAREREITAELLADIAEFDERQLYREEGYESLSAWCIGVLHLSKDCAHKRIHAARAARQHPAIFHMVATGRLHLTAVVVLATALKPLTAEAALELLEAAAHKTVEQIELILAGRFPKPDVMERIGRVAAEVAPERLQLVANPEEQLALRQVSRERTSVTPRSPGRYLVQLMFDEDMHADMEE